MIKKSLHQEKANAKINLALEVLDKRADGYHNLDTVFQAIDLADLITFSIKVECGQSDEIDFEINIDSDSDAVKNLGLDNSVTKAVETYFTEVPQEQVIDLIKSVHIDVFIEKNIPLEAGLAGGSADAAATLRALNKFFAENFDWSLSDKELCQLGLVIGSDVPFCVGSVTKPRQRGQGRGEILSPVAGNNIYDEFNQVILIKPDFGISTKVAYELLANYENEELPEAEDFYNQFEAVIFDNFPELLNIHEDLLEIGCSYSLLSGSGSTMIGFVDRDQNLDELFQKAKKLYSSRQGYEIFKAKFL